MPVTIVSSKPLAQTSAPAPVTIVSSRPLAINPPIQTTASQNIYDFGAASLAGVQPPGIQDGASGGHMPSDFKGPDHPNRVVGGFDTKTLARVPGTPRLYGQQLVEQGWSPDTARYLDSLPEVPYASSFDAPGTAREAVLTDAALNRPTAIPQRLNQPAVVAPVTFPRTPQTQLTAEAKANRPPQSLWEQIANDGSVGSPRFVANQIAGLAEGVLGISEGIGGFMQWLGDPASPNMASAMTARTGEKLADASKYLAGLIPQDSKANKDIVENPEALADPVWWSRNVFGRGAGSMLGFLVPMAATTKVVDAGVQTLKVGKALRTILSYGSGVAAGSTVESAVEAGLVMREVLGETGDQAKASNAAAFTFKANIALNTALGMAGYVLPKALSFGRVVQAASGAFGESLQESAQQIISNYSTGLRGPDLFRGVPESALIGFTMGGPVGVTEFIEAGKTAPIATPPTAPAQKPVSTPPAVPVAVSGEGKSAPGTLTPPPEIAPQNAATEATGEPAWTPPSESAPSAATPLIASPTSSAAQPPEPASGAPSAAAKVAASEEGAEAGAEDAPTVLAQEPAQRKAVPYRRDAVHISTPEGVAGIRASGYDLSRSGKGGIGGDDYGPAIYLSDRASDMGSYWRQQLATRDFSGEVPTAAVMGKVDLQRPLEVEDLRPTAQGHMVKLDRADIVRTQMPEMVGRFDALVESGKSKNQALGVVAREAGYDGIVFHRQAGDEIVVFDPSRVAFAGAKPAATASKLAQSAAASKASFDAKQAAKQTESPEFKAWFGASKVVDEQGKPRVVYHGTADDVTAFDLDHPNRKDTGWLGTGVYVTTSAPLAGSYATLKRGSAGENVMPLFAKLENPYYATQAEKQRIQLISHNQGKAAGRAAADAWTRALKAKGHDGVILRYDAATVGEKNVSDEIVVFDPAGVKSAIGNRGTFDAKSPSILEQESASDKPAKLPGWLKAAMKTQDESVFGKEAVYIMRRSDDTGSAVSRDRKLDVVYVPRDEVTKRLRSGEAMRRPVDSGVEQVPVVFVDTESAQKPEGKRESFSRAALRRVFGYGRDVANTTADVLEAIGLPASRVALQKGGTPAADALPRTEAEAADVFAKSILSQDTGSDVLIQVQNLDAWKVAVADYLTSEGHSQRTVDGFIGEIESQLRILAAFGPLQIEMLPRSLRDKDGKSLLAPTPKRGKKAGWGGPIRKNQDPMYRITYDATAMCVKRLEAAATASYVQRKIGRALTTSERMALVALFRSVGKQSPCVYCYVEAPRAKSAEFVGWAMDALSGKKKVPPKWKTGKMAPAFRAAQHELAAKGKTTSDVDVNFTLDMEQAKSDAGLMARHQLPLTYGFLDKVMLSAKANLPKLYEEYEGQILQLHDGLIEDLNQYGGMRFFSSSDFQVDHLVDLMQAFWDLTARKMKAHGYTKVPWFVEIFGGTGMKIQTSVFAQRDAQGNIVMDDTQGMDWDIAKAARKKHDHVGTILVATDDGIVQWGLEQDWIDYIIPFHYSSLEKKFYGALEWQDFTSTQTEKPITKGASAKKIRMHEVTGGKAISDAKATRKYLELALQRKVYPVFTSFLFRDYTVPAKTGKESKDVAVRNAATKSAKARWAAMVKAGKIDWSQINPNYFKLRKDYARSDTDFVPVNARGVDVDAAKRALESFFAGNEPAAKVDEELAGALEDMIVAAQVSGVDVGADALTKVKAGVKLVPDYKGVVPPKRTTLESAPVKFHKTAPKKLAQSPSVLFQENPDAANTWYYDNVVEALKSWQNKGTSQQLLAHLGKTKGALEEAEDIGLTGWLKARPNVTRAEAQAFVDQHKVVLEETVLGGEGIHGESWDPEISILREEGYDIDGDPVDDESPPFLITRAGEQIDDLPIGPDGRIDVDKLELMRRAEWASGDAIHVPDRAVEAFNRIIDKQEQEYRQGGGGLEYEGYQAIKGGTNPREILLKLPITPETDARRSRADYVAPHYSGANAQNLLLHTRVWDYTLPDGRKILVAKEIQSDWHQEGRKEGYQGDSKSREASLRAEMDGVGRGQMGVPDAPFKGHAWKRLALKRLLAYAAEGGYDGIGWTTGAQQTALYEDQLRRRVDRISWVKDERQHYAIEVKRDGQWESMGYAGGFPTQADAESEKARLERFDRSERRPVHETRVVATEHGNDTMVRAEKNGEVVFSGRVRDGKFIGSQFGGKTIEEVLGKEVAAKIESDVAGDLKGDDLTVGGEGMKGFYDRELVNLANDLAKKHGQRVAQIAVPTEEVPGAPMGLAKVGIHENPVPKGVKVNHNGWSIVMTDGTKWGIWSKKADATAAMERLKVDPLSLSSPKTIHFLPTPPAMRAEIAAKKQALYQGVPADAQASVEFYDEGGYTKAVIRALNNPDASSALHEIAHVARRFLLNRDVPLEQRLGVDEADIVEAEKFCGVKDGAWTVKAEERFARAFERYMRDGISPSPKLTKVFNAFAKWLTQVYATIKGSPIDIEITPEMRGVFDRLMTRSERLAQREKAQQEFEAKKAQKQTDTPSFKAWFKGSKVVDEKGEPLVVYHGMSAFTEFSKTNAFSEDKRGKATGAPSAKKAFFFAGSKGTSVEYAGLKDIDPPWRAWGSLPANFNELLGDLRYVLMKGAASAPQEAWDWYGDLVETLVEAKTPEERHDILEEHTDMDRNMPLIERMQERAWMQVDRDDVAETLWWDLSREGQVKGEQPEVGSARWKRFVRDHEDEIWERVQSQADEDVDPWIRLMSSANLPDPKQHRRIYEWKVGTKPDDMKILRVYLRLQNPLVYDYNGSYREESFNKLLSRAMEEGRDGAIFKNVRDGGGLDTIYAVFSPSQIKSATGNRGTFDPQSPNILEQRPPTRNAATRQIQNRPDHQKRQPEMTLASLAQ